MGDAARKLSGLDPRIEALGDADLADAVPSAQIPVVLTQLAGLTTRLSTRLLQESVADDLPDELLDATATAAMLRVSTDYIYTHSARFPFTRRQGRKVLFSRNGIQQYIRRGR